MDYIFGYGSIIQDGSRLSTLKMHDDTIDRNPEGHGFSGGSSPNDRACAAKLMPECEKCCWKRTWSFRSSSGFTGILFFISIDIHVLIHFVLALGLSECSTEESVNTGVFGVLFPVDGNRSLAAFDLREKGYRRVLISNKSVCVITSLGSSAAKARAEVLKDKIESNLPDIKIWTYIPKSDHNIPPDEEFPIIQTYLDVCIRGCLEWGGRELALEFIRSTDGWSPYFLNDAPMSRRPWLHRKDYMLIDECLAHLGKECHFADRKHPEEFSADYLSPLSGLWGVPPRNNHFVGRSNVLREIQETIGQDSDISQEQSTTIATAAPLSHGSHQVGIFGLGGVGKTQTAVEFVHRQYSGGKFGLVIWFRSTAAEDVASDMRRFAFDSGILQSNQNQAGEQDAISDKNSVCNIDFDDDKIADEVRRKLARSRCNWLVVLDNVEDPSILVSYAPFLQPCSRSRGFGMSHRGHILLTSRFLAPAWKSGNCITLDCFDEEESVHYLNCALGTSDFCSIDNNSPTGALSKQNVHMRDLREQKAYYELAERMGCLPLALSVAAAYMRRCDVSVEEYVQRLNSVDVNMNFHLESEENVPFRSIGIAKVNESIVTSLTMSLDRIRIESISSSRLVPCLGYLYPDNITKKFIGALVNCVLAKDAATKRVNKQLLLSLFDKSIIHYSNGSSVIWDIACCCKKTLYKLFCLYVDRNALAAAVFALPLILLLFPYLLSTDGCSPYFYLLCLFISSGYFIIHLFGFLRLCELHFTYDRLGISGSLLVAKEKGPEITKNNKTSNFFLTVIPKFDVSLIPPFSSYTRSSGDVPVVSAGNFERVSAERDSFWELMIQFSIMTVRGTRNVQRIGSVHRLQQSVIQSQCSRPQAAKCLEHCIEACCSTWSFKYQKPDVSAWDSCGQLLPHIEVLWHHVSGFLNLSEVIKPSASGGVLMHTAMLDCVTSYKFLKSRESGTQGKKNFAAMKAYVGSVLVELMEHTHSYLGLTQITVNEELNDDGLDFSGLFSCNRYCSTAYPFAKECLRWRVLLDFAHLCIQAGLYASVVQSKFDSAQSFLYMALDLLNYLGWVLRSAPQRIKRNFPSQELHIYVTLSSLALYHLGKTLRYSALFEKADVALRYSLQIVQQLSESSPEISDTLHEMGVLRLKMHRLADAKVLLSRSLEMKNQLEHDNFLSSSSSHVAKFSGDTSVASTLHQIGVVCRAQRKYDDAEDLLKKSLINDELNSDRNMESYNRLTSRAATVQQLGRITLRKGDLDKARHLFNEALELYERSYGEKYFATHINTIAVRHQLGNTAVAERR